MTVSETERPAMPEGAEDRTAVTVRPTTNAGDSGVAPLPASSSTAGAVALRRPKWHANVTAMAYFGAAIVALTIIAAIFADLISPYDPLVPDPSAARLADPSTAHWFGTDQYGRDVFSRVLAGARVSLVVGTLVTLAALVIGGGLGVVAGYFGGLVDTITGRLADMLLAVPGILLAIAIVATLGGGVVNVCIALAIGQIPIMLRMTRADTIAVRERTFVRAAVAIGAPPRRILLRHVSPFVLGTAAVQGTFVFAHAILFEAALSFLGIGVKPPLPTWGNMISEARPFLTTQPWNSIFPGIAVTIVVLGVNFLGDGLRDIVDTEGRISS